MQFWTVLGYFTAAIFLVEAANEEKESGIFIPGDIVIGGVFPVHGAGTHNTPCATLNKERGIQRLEAMRFAVQQVNDDPNLLKGVTLGMRILDSCSDATYALDESIEFVMSTLAASQVGRCPPSSNSTKSRHTIVAVIGAAYSKVSKQIANLLRLFQIPQISYASTSAELSKKERYAYFMRTVPPDKLQAKTLVDIVEHLNWTYVSTIASNDDYGVSGIDSFKEQYLVKTGRCISVELKVSSQPDDDEFLNIVEELYNPSKARVVILFVGQDDAANILKAATQKNYINDFIWVASDGWGNGKKPVDGNEETAAGALTVMLKSNVIKDFDDYFNKLTPSTNKENVWFNDYWQDLHNCTFTSDGENTNVCNGKEVDTKYAQESKIQFVYDALYVVALGLDRLYREICGPGADSLCEEMNLNNSMRRTLLQYMMENNVSGKRLVTLKEQHNLRLLATFSC